MSNHSEEDKESLKRPWYKQNLGFSRCGDCFCFWDCCWTTICYLLWLEVMELDNATKMTLIELDNATKMTLTVGIFGGLLLY